MAPAFMHMLLTKYYVHDYTYECPESVTNSSQQLMADKNRFAMFLDLVVSKDDARGVFFTLKDALKIWKEVLVSHRFASFMKPVPKESEVKTQFVEQLGVPCQERPHSDKSRHYPRSGFRGFRLRTVSEINPNLFLENRTLWLTEHAVREYAGTLTKVLPGESSPSRLRPRRFDIHCTTIDLFIEVDGEQHFRSVPRFPGCFRERQKVDAWEMRQALQHGFSIVRLSQEDAVKDNIDWRSQLRDIVSATTNGRSKPAIWYLAKSADQYSAHKTLMS